MMVAHSLEDNKIGQLHPADTADWPVSREKHIRNEKLRSTLNWDQDRRILSRPQSRGGTWWGIINALDSWVSILWLFFSTLGYCAFSEYTTRGIIVGAFGRKTFFEHAKRGKERRGTRKKKFSGMVRQASGWQGDGTSGGAGDGTVRDACYDARSI